MSFSKNLLKKGPGCIVPEIVEHEFLHAMGMMHEQSRPDRDNFLKINWGNIKEEYHSQYFMMHSSFWDNQGYKLDKWSVMMYPWYGFLTDEAKQNQLSSMSELGSEDPIQKPRQVKMTAIDAIQLQKERLIFQPLRSDINF